MPVCYACPQVIQRAQPVDPLTRGVVLGDQQRAPAVNASARLRPAPAEADREAALAQALAALDRASLLGGPMFRDELERAIAECNAELELAERRAEVRARDDVVEVYSGANPRPTVVARSQYHLAHPSAEAAWLGEAVLDRSREREQ